MRKWLVLYALAAVAMLASVTPLAGQGPDDPATRAARQLMHRSLTVASDGSHHQLLRALRHLEDPDLQPLFARLLQANHPVIRINAILGITALEAKGQMDLKYLALTDDPNVQSELVTYAMDADLLSVEQARELLSWSNLNEGVKLLIALRLQEMGEFDELDFVVHASRSDLLGRQGVAALILTQAGDPRGRMLLHEINQSPSPQKDVVRLQMLQIVDRHQMDKARSWALALAKEQDIATGLELMGLRTALRLNEPAALERWRQRFVQADQPADRNRLAIVALESSPFVDPRLFDPLRQDSDPLLRQVGVTGFAIASESEEIAPEVVELINMDHPIINAWAYRYALDQASDQDAQVILLGLILAYNHSEPRRRDQRLDDAIMATAALMDRHPQAARVLLRPILADDATDPWLGQAILHGLITSQDREAWRTIDGLPAFINVDARSLALLLALRANQTLTPRQLENLGLIVRGAGAMPDTFRIQAAWAYLKQTGQMQAILQELISR